VILQCAGLLGAVTALSASGFTMIRNITKQLAAMTNLTTLKTSFMKTPIASSASLLLRCRSCLLATCRRWLYLTHTGGHRELSIVNCAELLEKRGVRRMRQEQRTAGIYQPLGYDLRDPRMQPGKPTPESDKWYRSR
jgi:hypothetical protein